MKLNPKSPLFFFAVLIGIIASLSIGLSIAGIILALAYKIINVIAS